MSNKMIGLQVPAEQDYRCVDPYSQILDEFDSTTVRHVQICDHEIKLM